MIEPQESGQFTTEKDSHRADLLEEISRKIEAGESVDLDQYEKKCPEHADRLRQLVPTMEVLGSVGLSSVDGDVSSSARLVGSGLEIGVLGDHKLIREIGRGGMGVVYEAQQISLGRRVALKVLPFAAVLDQKQLKRFKNEAQAAASLDHPNTVGVHSVGCERGMHYYAMPYIEGQSLVEVIDAMRLDAASDDRNGDAEKGSEGATSDVAARPPSSSSEVDTKPVAALSTERSADSPRFFRSVARLGVQAAEALDHAHQSGVVHRDIKPSNLMLDTHGHLWITDFGLAMTQTGANLTMTGDLLGTLRYMSSEQAAGNRIVLDHRTDIYSLGVTLYEMLTLKPAFPGNDRQRLLKEIVDKEPRRLRQENPAVPKDLETIVLKATAKERDSRYRSAQELADDLVRFLENKPIQARRSGQAERLWWWTKRNPVVASLTLTAAALLMSVAIVGNVGYVRTTAALNQVEVVLGQVEQERDTARKARESEAARRVEADKARDTARNAQEAERTARQEAEKARADEAAQRANALRYLGAVNNDSRHWSMKDSGRGLPVSL